ncbi:MAG: lipocalin family protein [Stenotrophomonas sp.]
MKPRACHRLTAGMFLLLASPLGWASTGTPNRPVDAIDLPRYTGLWYEIAHLPMYFQRHCVSDTTALYTAQADGSIAVRNRCRDADGHFRQADGQARQGEAGSARLKVRFAPGWLSWLPLVWADYWVIALDPQYRWAMVGGPDADTLWILSRSHQLPPQTYHSLVEQARAMGYPVERLQQTVHTAGPDPTPRP